MEDFLHDTKNLVGAFAQHHSFDPSSVMVEEGDAIVHAVTCHQSICTGYANLPAAVLEQDTAVGLLWQIYERCTERIFSAIVAMVTRCPVGSEILSRSSIEAAATLRYILISRNSNLASFLSNHIRETERHQRKWQAAIQDLHEHDQGIHIAARDHRQQSTVVLARFVEVIRSSLVGAHEVPAWPSIADRFRAIDENISYRTAYARLCAEPHLDAEETLRFFVGKTTDRATFEALAKETVAFSRFMLFEAVRWYASAGHAYATAYGMEEAIEACSTAEHAMTQQAIAISGAAGAIPRTN